MLLLMAGAMRAADPQKDGAKGTFGVVSLSSEAVGQETFTPCLRPVRGSKVAGFFLSWPPEAALAGVWPRLKISSPFEVFGPPSPLPGGVPSIRGR